MSQVIRISWLNIGKLAPWERRIGKCTQNGGDSGFLLSLAFKLDHLQPVGPILFQTFFISLTFILELPFHITLGEDKVQTPNFGIGRLAGI